MSYTALYRKFRPVSFDDVKGQDHIVTTLRNQIKADRIGHAYMFCGTRGTGKTTVAKIFARAVNCENPVNGSPCGQCPTCQAIASGAALNVIEIDAASNTGVDNVREIIDEVAYSPTAGRFKVYIIDEAHMLSPGAFNALLKTLEEPPEYVIFILATTEPHRLLATIQSRCQRYDFHRITIDTIQARLREICDAEGLSVEDHALKYLARTGDGSMRDALSLLDQCVAFHYGETLTYDMALDVLGAVDTSVFDHILNAVYAQDVVGAMNILQDVVDQGRELSQFNNDLIWYIRSVMFAKTDAGLEDIIDINSEDMAALKATATLMDMDTIMTYIHDLSELTSQLRYSSQKRILLEVALIRMCRPGEFRNVTGTSQPVGTWEDKTENSGRSDTDSPEQSAQTSSAPNDYYLMEMDDLRKRLSAVEEKIRSGSFVTDKAPAPKAKLPDAVPDDIKELIKRWDEVVAKYDTPFDDYLLSARRSLTQDGRFELVWHDGETYAYNAFNKTEGRERLKDVIGEVIGKEIDPQVAIEKDKAQVEQKHCDLGELFPNMEIKIEDDTDPNYV